MIMSLVAVDGRQIGRGERMTCDVAVVGSGSGGATAGRALAEAGADVIILEEGRWLRPADFSTDPITTLSGLYRDCGLTTTIGTPMPLLQGRVLGGTSVVNSGICWRLPRDVYDQWLSADPALGQALPWEALDATAASIERALGVRPTSPAIAGEHDRLMARGARALALAHQPTNRNMAGCRGLGRCNQGCPAGAKMSMERSMLPAAAARGARIVTSVQVDEILTRGRAATGVAGRARGGGRLTVVARSAVVLAGGAIQTPALLLANRIRHGPVGRNFQCHPGLTVAGRFPEPVRAWTGATQGHEITSFMTDGIKLETVGLAPSLLASRLDSVGRRLGDDMAGLSHWATWGAGIRTVATGSVTRGRRRPRVRFALAEADVHRVRTAVGLLGDIMLAAGATSIAPGVAGWPARVSDRGTMARLISHGPADARAYSLAISHMFGTCKMGTDPATSVIRPDFRHHVIDRLYVADASVFPTNLGVNPQVSIMTMARCCADSITGIARRPEPHPEARATNQRRNPSC
jgi:choline dehydrogenase-like flavoprotein